MPRMLPPKNFVAGDLSVVRWMLILRPAIVTATLGAAMLLLPRETIDKFPIAVVLFGTYILTLLYWMTLRISGISRPLLAVQIAFDIFIITIIIHYTGGYDSSFVGFYFLSVMCASLFFRRIVTFIFSVQAVIFYIVYLCLRGPLLGSPFCSDSLRQSVMLQAILYSILIIGVGFFSSLYTEKLIVKDTALNSALKKLSVAALDTSNILQSMANGLIAFDMSGRIMYFNHAAEKILQIDRTSVQDTYRSVFAKSAPKLVKILDLGLDQNSYGSEEEIEILDRNGIPIPLGLTTVPLFDTDGSRRGVIVNFKDLTEKKKLIEMLRQSDRMAAIGELSAAIAHEIRNPLASICNAVELLVEDMETRDPQAARLLSIIEKESDRLQRISSEFLKFARLKTPDVQPLELKKAIEEVLILIENDPRKTDNVLIKSTINGNPLVYFDHDHMKQLIINILINSLEAMDGKGSIEIRLEKNRKIDDTYIRLLIADDGRGFTEEALTSMFEPFFSTKKEGTGLGLALVRKMMVSNHGRVFGRNRDTGGAEIVLDIPLCGV
jgi:two-component system, NtrC family, sensor histidine kinase PilS